MATEATAQSQDLLVKHKQSFWISNKLFIFFASKFVTLQKSFINEASVNEECGVTGGHTPDCAALVYNTRDLINRIFFYEFRFGLVD